MHPPMDQLLVRRSVHLTPELCLEPVIFFFSWAPSPGSARSVKEREHSTGSNVGSFVLGLACAAFLRVQLHTHVMLPIPPSCVYVRCCVVSPYLAESRILRVFFVLNSGLFLLHREGGVGIIDSANPALDQTLL